MAGRSRMLMVALLAASCSGDAVSGSEVIGPDWDQAAGELSPRHLGHNTVWSRGGLGLWDEAAHAPNAAVMPLVEALRPGVVRFPGGTRAMRYRFAETIGPVAERVPQCDTFTGELDATSYGLDEALRLAASVGAEVSLVSPWSDGTPEEVAAMVAYANADPASPVALGVDREGVDWGTAGAWAGRRAANGHAPPYGVSFLEIGNEQYLDILVGPATSCGRPAKFRQNERWESGQPVPTTAADYAEQIALTAALVRAVDPNILIGVAAMSEFGREPDAATAVSPVDRELGDGAAWNPTLVELAGDAFDFFVLHPYDFSTRDDRLTLVERAGEAVRGLRALAPDKRVAITEFGTLLDAGTLLNALLTADFVRLAVQEDILMSLRHILIEDDPRGPFAESAAILGAEHRLMPGYHATRLMVDELQPVAVPADSGRAGLEVLATRDAAGAELAVLLIDKRLDAAAALPLRVALPDGTWTGTVTTVTGAHLTAPEVTVARVEASGVRGPLEVEVPVISLVMVRLSRD